MTCPFCAEPTAESACPECRRLVEAGDADGLGRRALDHFCRLQDATSLDGPALLARLRRLIREATE